MLRRHALCVWWWWRSFQCLILRVKCSVICPCSSQDLIKAFADVWGTCASALLSPQWCHNKPPKGPPLFCPKPPSSWLKGIRWEINRRTLFCECLYISRVPWDWSTEWKTLFWKWRAHFQSTFKWLAPLTLDPVEVNCHPNDSKWESPIVISNHQTRHNEIWTIAMSVSSHYVKIPCDCP